MEKLHTRCTLAQESKDQLEKVLQEKVSALYERDQLILSLTEEVHMYVCVCELFQYEYCMFITAPDRKQMLLWRLSPYKNSLVEQCIVLQI